MRSYPKGLMVVLYVCLFFLFTLLFAHAQPEGEPPPDKSQTLPKEPEAVPAPPEVSDRSVSIDFNDVDITVFIKFISELTGKNFIIDSRVKGKVTVISPTKVSVDEAYKVFESVLEVNGFALVEAGEVTKIIPSPYARTMNIETRFQKEKDSPEDKIVTQIIRLAYADPEEVKQLCAPLVSKSSVVLSYPPTNMLIITDVYSNIKRLLGIIEAIDVTGIGKQISTIPVEFATAEDLLKIIDSVFNANASQRKGGQKDVVMVSDERTNTIIALASEADTARVKDLVRMLDKEVPRGKEKIHVYYLENAKAEDLAVVLQEIPSKEGTPQEGQGKKLAPLVSEDVKIKADKATNSLIIVAEKDEYEIIKEIIQKLDIRRSMVYIECLIMEVSKDRSLNMGAEWLVGGNAHYLDKKGVYGGGFSGGATGGGDSGYIGSLSQGLGKTPVLPPGFSLGVFGEDITVGNVTFPTIAAIINAYKKDKDVHILSTPQILTTDNEKAKITVGKNIPFLTKASTGDTNYSNYEYKDVGISLEITPQISKDRKIRLEIAQEVTKLETTTDLFQPTTLKRSINTVVVIDDANTVVVGGLIDDSLSATNYQVPCLGGIPVIGWLFRSMGRGHEETNLFVFLTPHVVQSAEEIKELHEEKQETIDKMEEGQINLFEFGKDDFLLKPFNKNSGH